MTYTTIISPVEAARHAGDPQWAFVDCRFYLTEPERGREEYVRGHLPGAVFADLEVDLSGPVVPGVTGRHPLPAEESFSATMSRLGIDDTVQVVAYDASTGAMAAARLWWLLRWSGHDAVTVLDGGLRAWEAAGLPQTSGVESRAPRRFEGRYQPDMLVDAHQVRSLQERGAILLDARANDRYRGENETIDPLAGHIPGALSLPYAGNLSSEGTFLGGDELRDRYAGLAGDRDTRETVAYCGSGVSAAHTILAHVHAGLNAPRLYAGSWSEWITDPSRPIVTGEEPG